MTPASLGAASESLVYLYLSSSSRWSPSHLPRFWLLVRVSDSLSMERFPPGDSRIYPRSLEASRSKRFSPRRRRLQELAPKHYIWFDSRCLGSRPPPKPPDFSRRPTLMARCGSMFSTKGVEARRWFYPSLRAWLPSRVVVDMVAGEQPVMWAKNPRIQAAISDQGTLPVPFFRISVMSKFAQSTVALLLCFMKLASRLLFWIGTVQVIVPSLTDGRPGFAQFCFTIVCFGNMGLIYLCCFFLLCCWVYETHIRCML
ncbi:hypothetical protein GQ457_11G021280 [Hibiscus cannabinus]